MGVGPVGDGGVDEGADGDDVVDVRVPAEVRCRGATDDAGMVVAIQGGQLGPPPVLAVGFVAASFPVGVAFAGEGVGEPFSLTLSATKSDFIRKRTPLSSYYRPTKVTSSLNLSTIPFWMVWATESWRCLPLLVSDTIGAVSSRLFRGIVLELFTT